MGKSLCLVDGFRSRPDQHVAGSLKIAQNEKDSVSRSTQSPLWAAVCSSLAHAALAVFLTQGPHVLHSVWSIETSPSHV